MTDLERFVALYRSFGVECIVSAADGGFQIQLAAEDYADEEKTFSPRFDGYHGFYSRVSFDANGQFVSQGFWE